MQQHGSRVELAGGVALLVDDDAFVRGGLSAFLATEGYRLLEAIDAVTAWQLLGAGAAFPPVDAAIVDIAIPPEPGTPSHPGYNYGLSLVARIKGAYPALGVVLFSAYEDRGGEVLDLLRQGARGLAYKVKGCPPETLLDAIREVRAGRVLIDPDVTSPLSLADALTAQLSPDERELVSRALDRFDQLSAREGEVLSRFAASHSTESIARAMGLSLKTVENHISHAYDKLRLTDAPPAWRRQTLLVKACMIHDLRREQVRPRH